MTEWVDDIFDGYQAATIGLESEGDGELVGTIVRRQTEGGV